MQYAQVILPLAAQGTFTYLIPHELSDRCMPGIRVEVEFGKQKKYAGIILKITTENHVSSIKPILDIIDDQPILYTEQLRLWEWISEYYLCGMGEVMLAALPGGFKLASETKICKVEHLEYSHISLSDDEFLVLEALDLRQELSIQELIQILQRKKILGIVKELQQKQFIRVIEQLEETEKTVMHRWVKLADEYSGTSEAVYPALNQVQRSDSQSRILLAYLSEKKDFGWIKANALLRICGSDSAALKTLVKKNIFIELYLEKFKTPEIQNLSEELRLSEYQSEAILNIERAFSEKPVVLLKGITGSGKTQVYIHFIKSMIQEGKQVLYMVPEIALTSQLVQRIQKYFPDQTLEYHSGLSPKDRISVWNQCLEGHPVVIGARSSVFLPFKNLGCIIVDEEHDSSYKQNEPVPRYHGRDAAIMLAQEYGAKVLLGSATPSLESYQQAVSERISMVRMDQRFGEAQLPEMKIISLKDAKRKSKIDGNFTHELIEEIKAQIAAGKQILVFRNRRGYSPLLQCGSCQWECKCHQCDIHLTFHKTNHQMKCHICGFQQETITVCPECGKGNLKLIGFGTEKLEEEIKELFPDLNIARFDQESARSRIRQIQIMDAFQNKEIDILVGTQMVSKGLDFDHIGLVVIIQADQILHFPDFRANERAFQLMTQVSGRSGRRSERGKVLIQAYQIDNPVIKDVLEQEYSGFAERELREREKFHYPPFIKLIRLSLRGPKLNELETVSELLTSRLRNSFGGRVLGPADPALSRIKGLFVKELFIKVERNQKKLKEVKAEILHQVEWHKKNNNRNIRIYIDVDPM